MLTEYFDSLDIAPRDDQLSFVEISPITSEAIHILELDGNEFITRAELHILIDAKPIITSIFPEEAWIFDGISAEIQGINLQEDLLIRFGAPDTGTIAQLYSISQDGTSALLIVPVSTDSVTDDGYYETLTPVLPVGGDPAAPADNLIYGIARTGTNGTALISNLPGIRQSLEIADISLYFYEQPPIQFGEHPNPAPIGNTPPSHNTPPPGPNQPTAITPESGTSFDGGGLGRIQVGATEERVRLDANGNEVPVEPLLLTFRVGDRAIRPDDVREGLTLWSAPSNFDYHSLELAEDTTGSIEYQSTRINSEVSAVLTDLSTSANWVNTARLYSLNGFSLRARAPMAPEVVSAILNDPRNTTSRGETTRNGGVDMTDANAMAIYSPLSQLARVDRIEFTVSDGAKGTSGALVGVSDATVLIGQGTNKTVLEFTTLDFTSSGVTVDATIFLLSDPDTPAVTLDDFMTLDTQPPCSGCGPVSNPLIIYLFAWIFDELFGDAIDDFMEQPPDKFGYSCYADPSAPITEVSLGDTATVLTLLAALLASNIYRRRRHIK